MFCGVLKGLRSVAIVGMVDFLNRFGRLTQKKCDLCFLVELVGPWADPRK